MADPNTFISRAPANRPHAATIRVAHRRLTRQLRRLEAEAGSAQADQTDSYLRRSYALIDLLRLAVAERTDGKL